MSPKLLNVLLILVPAVLYYGYLSPMYEGVTGFVWTPEHNINSLKSQNVQYANTLQQVTLVEQEVGKINKEFTSVDKNLIATTTLLLPDIIDPIKLRNEVTSIANKTGVALTGLTVSPETRIRNPNLTGYRVSFTVNSRYSVLKSLLENYEKSTRLFIPESITIVKAEKKTGASRDLSQQILDDEALITNIIFSVYYLK